MGYKKSLAIDAVALDVFVVASVPSFTGIGLHEWLGIATLLVLLAHCAFGIDHALDAAKRHDFSSLARGVVPFLLLAALAATVVSGIMISGNVLPFFGLVAPGFYFWNPLHAVAAKALLALLIVHVALHERWIRNAFKKLRKGASNEERSC